jgi:hypothetical protein
LKITRSPSRISAHGHDYVWDTPALVHTFR